jgi:hypothetical protein
MDRTTAPGSIAGQYIDDDPANEIQGTLLVAKDRNAIQEELINVITAAGLTPSAGTLTQLRDAVRNASNLSTGTLPDARLSSNVQLRSRVQLADVGLEGFYRIATGAPWTANLIKIRVGRSGEIAHIIAAVSSNQRTTGTSPRVNILAASSNVNTSRMPSIIATHQADAGSNHHLYVYFPQADAGRTLDIEIITSRLENWVAVATPTRDYTTLADFDALSNASRQPIRYNEGIDAARIGGQLASNIPKLDQANTFAPGVVQTTGQQEIVTTQGFSIGAAGKKVDGFFVGNNDDGKASLWLIARQYGSTLLPGEGFIGDVTQLRGSIGNIRTTRCANVIVHTAYNNTAPRFLSNDTSSSLVTTTYLEETWYGILFNAASQSRITASGIIFGNPIFVPDATAYTTTPVPTASLQALRGKFNAADLAEGTLADARLPTTAARRLYTSGIAVPDKRWYLINPSTSSFDLSSRIRLVVTANSGESVVEISFVAVPGGIPGLRQVSASGNPVNGIRFIGRSRQNDTTNYLYIWFENAVPGRTMTAEIINSGERSITIAVQSDTSTFDAIPADNRREISYGKNVDADLLDGVQGSGYVKWAGFNPWLVYSNSSASAQTYTLPDMAVGAVFTYYIRLQNASAGTIFNTVRLPTGGTYSFDVRHGVVSGGISDGTVKDITAFLHDYANSVGGTGTVASVAVSAGNTGLFIAKVRRIS